MSQDLVEFVQRRNHGARTRQYRESKLRRPLIFTAGAAVILALAAFGYRTFGDYSLHGYLTKLRAGGERVTMGELAASLSPGVDSTSITLSNLVVKLGPPPANFTNLEFMQFVSGGRAQVSWKLRAPPWKSSLGSGEVSDWSGLADCVKQMAAPLADLRLAMTQPALNAGPRTNIFFQTGVPLNTIRCAAGWLACATLAELRAGHSTEALDNLQALAGLANLYREEYTVQNTSMRVRVSRAGLDLTWEILQQAGLSEDQLSTLQKSWESVDLLDGLERAFQGQRCWGMEAFKFLLGSRPSVADQQANFSRFEIPIQQAFTKGKELWMATMLANDLRFGMGLGQERVELIRSLRRNLPLKGVAEQWQTLDAQLDGKNRVPLRFFYSVTLLSTPNTTLPLLQTTRVETERRLAVTAIALARYKNRFGQYPASLEKLVPTFMSSVPRDCMSRRTLCYQCNADGTFRLYSVGEDGTDNGGDPSPSAAHGKPGLWDGRDAVWPWPVS